MYHLSNHLKNDELGNKMVFSPGFDSVHFPAGVLLFGLNFLRCGWPSAILLVSGRMNGHALGV